MASGRGLAARVRLEVRGLASCLPIAFGGLTSRRLAWSADHCFASSSAASGGPDVPCCVCSARAVRAHRRALRAPTRRVRVWWLLRPDGHAEHRDRTSDGGVAVGDRDHAVGSDPVRGRAGRLRLGAAGERGRRGRTRRQRVLRGARTGHADQHDGAAPADALFLQPQRRFRLRLERLRVARVWAPVFRQRWRRCSRVR